MTKKQMIFSNLFWGFALWLSGYALGFVFFSFVPKQLIGWFILPFGVTATLLVLIRYVKRDKFKCYVGVGVFWTLIAVVLDYIFIIRLLQATDYYKLDVYVYYALTFLLPVLVGLYKRGSLESHEN